VTHIESGGFYGNTSLTSLTLGSGLVSVAFNAFAASQVNNLIYCGSNPSVFANQNFSVVHSCPQVGDVGPGGGIVFYDAGSVQSWGRYLEVACNGWQNNCSSGVDPFTVWGCAGLNVAGAAGMAIGTGLQNTKDIINGCPEVNIAAKLADDLELGGKNDWFLPSRDELNELCKWAQNTGQAAGAGTQCSGGSLRTGFDSGSFWSSSEYIEGTSEGVWYRYLGIGFEGVMNKPANLYVRPVRAF
jgi:hypothetical protein